MVRVQTVLKIQNVNLSHISLDFLFLPGSGLGAAVATFEHGDSKEDPGKQTRSGFRSGDDYLARRSADFDVCSGQCR